MASQREDVKMHRASRVTANERSEVAVLPVTLLLFMLTFPGLHGTSLTDCTIKYSEPANSLLLFTKKRIQNLLLIVE
jgi:hypothetical protein